MAAVTLRKLPDDLHIKVRRIQLEMEEKGKKINLEELYISFIKEGLKKFETENPGK